MPYEGRAEGHQSSNGEGWNIVLAFPLWLFEILGLCPELKELLEYLIELLGFWLGPRPVSQCSYLDVDHNIKSHTLIYKEIVRRGTMTPYTFKFNDPAHIVTGIACGPQDDKTSSPEAEVVDGGIGCHHVTIRLSPVQKGPWACSIEITGQKSTACM